MPLCGLLLHCEPSHRLEIVHELTGLLVTRLWVGRPQYGRRVNGRNHEGCERRFDDLSMLPGNAEVPAKQRLRSRGRQARISE